VYLLRIIFFIISFHFYKLTFFIQTAFTRIEVLPKSCILC